MTEPTHGYICSCRVCDGWQLLTTDEPSFAPDVAKAARAGLVIERFPVQVIKESLRSGAVTKCVCGKKPRKTARDRRQDKYVPL